ncbi:MAG: Smr/MutS family protein, partial [Acidobacteria bacterium]|nr:Smr/MutS family protein [Acidobacteriota bacterium]
MGQDDPVHIPVADVLDLHTFAPSDVVSVVEEYLLEARKKFRSVRLVHGRGTGYQRERVRWLLARLDFVAHFGDAPEQAGGWGATLVWFRDVEQADSRAAEGGRRKAE